MIKLIVMEQYKSKNYRAEAFSRLMLREMERVQFDTGVLQDNSNAVAHIPRRAQGRNTGIDCERVAYLASRSLTVYQIGPLLGYDGDKFEALMRSDPEVRHAYERGVSLGILACTESLMAAIDRGDTHVARYMLESRHGWKEIAAPPQQINIRNEFSVDATHVAELGQRQAQLMDAMPQVIEAEVIE
jgi:hypothetical protein